MAVEEKDSILESIPVELREKGSLVHASLIDGKVLDRVMPPLISQS